MIVMVRILEDGCSHCFSAYPQAPYYDPFSAYI